MVPLLICGVVFTGCKKKDDTDDNIKKTVKLVDSDDNTSFEKTVILYENENYLIKTPLAFFLSRISFHFIDKYEDQFSTLEKIISDGKTECVLYSSSYFDTEQAKYVLADFLENGFCYFYDKKNKNNIKQIVVEYWGYGTTQLAKSGGRRFYIYNNVLFLEVVDW